MYGLKQGAKGSAWGRELGPAAVKGLDSQCDCLLTHEPLLEQGAVIHEPLLAQDVVTYNP